MNKKIKNLLNENIEKLVKLGNETRENRKAAEEARSNAWSARYTLRDYMDTLYEIGKNKNNMTEEEKAKIEQLTEERNKAEDIETETRKKAYKNDDTIQVLQKNLENIIKIIFENELKQEIDKATKTKSGERKNIGEATKQKIDELIENYLKENYNIEARAYFSLDYSWKFSITLYEKFTGIETGYNGRKYKTFSNELTKAEIYIYKTELEEFTKVNETYNEANIENLVKNIDEIENTLTELTEKHAQLMKAKRELEEQIDDFNASLQILQNYSNNDLYIKK